MLGTSIPSPQMKRLRFRDEHMQPAGGRSWTPVITCPAEPHPAQGPLRGLVGRAGLLGRPGAVPSCRALRTLPLSSFQQAHSFPGLPGATRSSWAQRPHTGATFLLLVPPGCVHGTPRGAHLWGWTPGTLDSAPWTPRTLSSSPPQPPLPQPRRWGEGPQRCTGSLVGDGHVWYLGCGDGFMTECKPQNLNRTF